VIIGAGDASLFISLRPGERITAGVIATPAGTVQERAAGALRIASSGAPVLSFSTMSRARCELSATA
jgi:hypothetical protein